MTIKYFIRILSILILFQASAPSSLWAQNWGVIKGLVTDATTGEAIPGVTVVVEGTQTGTATNEEGRFSFRVPERTWIIRFSYVGFESVEKQVDVLRDREAIVNIQLEPTAIQMQSVDVEGESVSEDISTEIITPEQIQNMPAPFKDAYRILKILPGVVTNNELSNEYSVRGGGYNENQVLVNGFEIYKPLRVRQGEQEGLGLVNPDMVKTMTFYTGGFPARYGGKLSSALDVEYKFPTQATPTGSVSMSLLDASAAVGASALNNRLSGNFGFRKARPTKFFGTQDIKGEYDPDYTDFQAAIKWEPKDGQELQLLALKSQQEFRLQPTIRNTQFGSLDFLQSIRTNYRGLENDSYDINFVGLRSVNKVKDNFTAVHGISLFEIDERENIDISGTSILFLIPDPFEPDPTYLPTGVASQEDFAENEVTMRDLTARGKYLLTSKRQVGEAGWYYRSLSFSDHLNEKTILQGQSIEGLAVRTVVDSLFDSASLDASQYGGYAQHIADIDETAGRFILTSGIRADYFTFNDQWAFSPRLSARYRRTENLTLSAALGVYHQFPTYKELRGAPEIGTPVAESLNNQIKAQRSTQLITGLRYFYPKYRFFLKAEAYFKKLDNIITYDVDNIRLDYSGVNDANGHTYGLDLQVRGEIVPGLESWFNYGFLVSRATFLDEYLNQYNQGSRRRPGDQRHTFSVFVQDYVPNDPSWKLHLRLLFGSGLPFTPPVPGQNVGDFSTRIPGPRLADEYPSYQRVDMGATKSLVLYQANENSKPVSIHFTGEVLNVFDAQNVISYQWIADVTGRWNRIPTRLTPRTFNIRTRIDF